MRGKHYLKSWSSTQKTIALSSGEAELTAAVKCSCEIIGILQLAADWGERHEGRVYVDSSAALGVVRRQGAGKLRHVRVGQLWIQQKCEEGELRYGKVKGTNNPADAMTKPMNKAELGRYIPMMGIVARAGRAEASLKVTN